VGLAKRWLLQIKYQQTFTSGWSGGIKIPLGVEASLNNALTVAEKQMSNPDIVSSFKEFLSNISADKQIIVGIDELDKLESNEKAQLFLNEIKSIFGIPNCFFLISVSENAMSQFERRGLPFRDVFDSTFDNIIYVDYMDLKDTKALLERRVIGKPMAFFCLSYCLSGGLARDVIRAFRQLIEIRNGNSQINDLGALCLAITQLEIKGKLRAASIAVVKIENDTEKELFLQHLFDIRYSPMNSVSLIQNLKEIQILIVKINERIPKDEMEKIPFETLVALSEELMVYLYFMLTLIDFFNNQLEEEKLRQAEQSGSIDQLAKVKQALAVNPRIAKKIIEGFRNQYNMTLVTANF
jgi:hypothetical protein